MLKISTLLLLLSSQFALANEPIEGVWSNLGGSFSFFSDGTCTISWATQGKFSACHWTLDGADLEIIPEDSETMHFDAIFDGEKLVLTDQQGQYQYKRNKSHSN